MTRLFSKIDYAQYKGKRTTSQANLSYHLRTGNLKTVKLPVYTEYKGEKILLREEELIIVTENNK